MLLPLTHVLIRGLGRRHGWAVTRNHLGRLRRIDPRLLDDAGIKPEATDAEIKRFAWQPHVVVGEAPAAAGRVEAQGDTHRPLAPYAALR